MISGFVKKSLGYQPTGWQEALHACPLIIGEHFQAKAHLEAFFGLHEEIGLANGKCKRRDGSAVSRIIDRLSETLRAWCVARCVDFFYFAIFESMRWNFQDLLFYPVRLNRPEAMATGHHDGAVFEPRATRPQSNKVFQNRVKTWV